jgi:plasmid stabilization system protein ParE
MLPAIRDSRIFAHGRSPDLKPSEFIISWRKGAMHIVRILHGKRDVQRILESERTFLA